MYQPVGRLRLGDLLRAAVKGQLQRGLLFSKCGQLRKLFGVLLFAGGNGLVGPADILRRRALHAVKRGQGEARLTQCRAHGLRRTFVDEDEQIQALLVGADLLELHFIRRFKDSGAQRLQVCLRRDGAEQDARVLRPESLQRERQLLPRHEALAHGCQPAFFRGQAAARVLRVQNGLGRVQRGGIGLVAEQLADGLLRPGGKQTALFGFIVFEGLQCGCEPGGRAEQRIRAFPVSGTEHLHPLRIRQRARRADLDAAEQLQLADQLRLLLRNAADPQLFHF